MRTSITILVALVLMGGVATVNAGLDPDPDGLGIYFDQYGNSNMHDINPFTPFPMYIVLTWPTFTELYGWQAAVREADTSILYMLSCGFPGGGANVGTGMQFSVGYELPLVTNTATVLATMQVMTQTRQSICLELTGIDHPAIADERPLLWIAPDSPTVVRVSSMFYSSVSAVINDYIPSRCGSVVIEEARTWGSLKALYR